jgi:drug/metabolite transporter (DMT)-like permease
MLAGVLLVTLVSIMDKVAIHASNPLFYSLATTVGSLCTLSLAMRISKQRVTASVRPLVKRLGVVGTLQGTTYVTYLLAVASGPIAYVSALRSTNILMGSLLGVFIFREKLTKPKVISFVLIIAGAAFLTLGSSK